MEAEGPPALTLQAGGDVRPLMVPEQTAGRVTAGPASLCLGAAQACRKLDVESWLSLVQATAGMDCLRVCPLLCVGLRTGLLSAEWLLLGVRSLQRGLQALAGKG
ncbi:unnamed protein product [Rangifer tarandus platyrhynchus]|uniref:Uncharacterized protein n=1 Tax=Rangifer tarandus platyrhynchus TaxID=3082113 RepID=A0ABN8Y173_RANTA|nr:unnamed protein product [Rangifer tarandus platyrhynchus]